MLVDVSYLVRMDEPQAHFFTVEMRIRGWAGDTLTLQMPVWTPGSYLVREYSRHLQDFTAVGVSGPIEWCKQAKQTWLLHTDSAADILVRYRVYANELTVRTSHLDSSHGYFNGACLFLYIDGHERQPQTVTVVPPNPQWQVTTALPQVPTTEGFTYQAEDFDELVDSPFEIGTHRIIPFTVLGKAHTLAVWGRSNLDYNRYLTDLESLIVAESKLFGGLPYEHYVFIVHFADGYGGLEHRNSTTLLYSRFELQPDEKYYRFLSLTAHEYFHLWNVKRIRPSTLDRFDYTGENYTRTLWFMEGVTSYYDEIFPLRARIYGGAQYLKLLAGHICRLQSTPGRRVQPLEEASFDTWIKQYRPGENSLNSQVSYYLKGQLVACLLDLHIRAQSDGCRSLDDVLVKLWSDYASRGESFPEQELTAIIAAAAGLDLAEFFDKYLRSTAELDYDRYFAPFGLLLVSQTETPARSYLGIRTQEREGRTTIQAIEADSPAQQAGLSPGDELLALGGWKTTHGNLKDRLALFAAGDQTECTLFRREALLHIPVRLAESGQTSYQIEVRDDATPAQRKLLQGWLGPTV